MSAKDEKKKISTNEEKRLQTTKIERKKTRKKILD